jgi:zinc transport system ATP-binding protein
MEKEIVSLKNVSFNYNGLSVLEDVSLSIKERDFLGIIGPNGGGKTTLLKMILGLIKPLKGEVKVFGASPEDGRKNIGYIPQASLFDRDFPVNVFDVVLMSRWGKSGLFGGFGKHDKTAAEKALEQVGMIDYRTRRIGSLSEGQKQRVFIARALTSHPGLLLLDEPTSSIDPAMQKSFYELLDKLKKTMAVVLVSHDIGIISGYVDKVACLNRKLFYHDSKDIKQRDLEGLYKCPIELIAGVPYKVIKEHQNK